MLGEKIAEFTGKSTGMRILPGDDFRYVKMEISWTGEGTVLGQPAQEMSTVEAFERLPGQVYNEGQGMFMTQAGGVIWRGQGISRMTGEGMGMSVRFSATFQAPVDGPLARLNGVIGVGEQEIGPDGMSYTGTIWEWK